MMVRADGWERRLSDLVEARRHMPFAHATNDCVSFAADAVIALTEADPLAPWRGYEEGESFDLLAIERALGRARQNVALARRGDIVLMPYPEAGMPHGLAVCLGRLSVAPGEAGLVFNPTRAARVFWPVGWEPL